MHIYQSTGTSIASGTKSCSLKCTMLTWQAEQRPTHRSRGTRVRLGSLIFTSFRWQRNYSKSILVLRTSIFHVFIAADVVMCSDCGVFGKSSAEYLNYALSNRNEWDQGQQVVANMLASLSQAIKQLSQLAQALRFLLLLTIPCIRSLLALAGHGIRAPPTPRSPKLIASPTWLPTRQFTPACCP